MTILLYGGSGFLGRHICEAFHNSGTDAVVVSRSEPHRFISEFAPSLEWHLQGSRLAEKAIKQADAVLYMANSSKPGSSEDHLPSAIENEIKDDFSLLHELSKSNPSAHVIFPSSGGQIYGSYTAEPAQENDCLRPTTPYGLGKLYCEQYLQFLNRNCGLKYTIFRLSNPVGHWQLKGQHGFVTATINAAVKSRKLQLFGAGENVRDYFDAVELSKFLVDYASRGGMNIGTFNLGSGVGVTENEVLGIVQKTLNCEVEVERKPARPFDLPYSVLDIGKANRELGWSPQVKLSDSVLRIKDGIDKAIEDI
ncbi:MAG: NAD-dependent epimerase/dehydratase family protein [Pseudomonadales bacterium]